MNKAEGQAMFMWNVESIPYLLSLAFLVGPTSLACHVEAKFQRKYSII
jgi:hypothetical protein